MKLIVPKTLGRLLRRLPRKKNKHKPVRNHLIFPPSPRQTERTPFSALSLRLRLHHNNNKKGKIIMQNKFLQTTAALAIFVLSSVGPWTITASQGMNDCCDEALERNAARSKRSTVVYVQNMSQCYLTRDHHSLKGGEWELTPHETIRPGETLGFASVSCGFMTGTEGTAEYVCYAHNCKLKLYWNRPFEGSSENSATLYNGPRAHYTQKSGGDGNHAVVRFFFRDL